ncbi:hypothetical protein B1694_09855 [Geobacillus zalihae]|nr:hypothetical protein I656_01017 [Geobacillus sp. WSUCF1]OQP15888.1 hypothetical protein B1693_11185 [Geobacillus zalihae]OQP22799.1 hypothetical protein B1694_09855 [Geobacillus zalihae]
MTGSALVADLNPANAGQCPISQTKNAMLFDHFRFISLQAVICPVLKANILFQAEGREQR